MLLEVVGQISDCSYHHLGARRPFLSTDILTLFGFCRRSSTVVNIMRRDLSSGQIIRFALPLSFTPNHMYLRAGKWLRSCHN